MNGYYRTRAHMTRPLVALKRAASYRRHSTKNSIFVAKNRHSLSLSSKGDVANNVLIHFKRISGIKSLGISCHIHSMA